MALQRVLYTLKQRQRKRKIEHARLVKLQAIDDAVGTNDDAEQIGDEIKKMSSKDIFKLNDEKFEVMGIAPNNTKARPRQHLS